MAGLGGELEKHLNAVVCNHIAQLCYLRYNRHAAPVKQEGQEFLHLCGYVLGLKIERNVSEITFSPLCRGIGTLT